MEKQTISDYKHKLATVCGMLGIGMVITMLSTTVLYQVAFLRSLVENHFMMVTFVTTLLMVINTSFFNQVSYEEEKVKKIMYYVLDCVMLSFPLLCVTTGTLFKSLIYTIILTAIFSVMSVFIPDNVVGMSLLPLTAIHPLVMVCSIYSILFWSIESAVSLIIMSINLHGGFLVYSGLLICNTQRLKCNAKYRKFDPLFSAFVLLMNIINIYYRIAVFLYETPVPTHIKCRPKPL